MIITIKAEDTGMFSDDFISEFGEYIDIELPNDMLYDYFKEYIYLDASYGFDTYISPKELYDIWLESLDNYEDDNIADVWIYCIEHGVNPIITDIW